MRSMKKSRATIAALAGGVAIISGSPAFACYTEGDLIYAENEFYASYNTWDIEASNRSGTIADYDSFTYDPQLSFCSGLPSIDQGDCISQAGIDRANFIDSLDQLIDVYYQDMLAHQNAAQEVRDNMCS
jgi:hypothetical protein